MKRFSSARDSLKGLSGACRQHLRRTVPAGLFALGLLACASAAQAIEKPLDAASTQLAIARAFYAPELHVEPALEASATLSSTMSSHTDAAEFSKRNAGTWQMRWDRRSDRPNLVQGSGVPLIPGRGNALSAAKIGLSANENIDLAVVEARLLDFVAQNGALLKTAGLEFQLDEKSTTAYGEGNSHWFVEFAQFKNGVRVEGANLFFRISNGNIVQFGSNLVAPVQTDTLPVSQREKSFELAFKELGFATGKHVAQMIDAGHLLLIPFAADGKGAGENYVGANGAGYAHRLAWNFVFRIDGDVTTYDVFVDAKTNRVIEVRDGNRYASATVDGGIFTTTNTGPETIVPMPFVAVTNGSAKVTDALGIYDYSGGTATTTLNGKYIRIVDDCGAISLANSTDGNLHLGTDPSTDCGSNGAGGAGNTRAARNAFYYMTRINRKAASFLPSNTWLAGKVTAEVNEADVCNAFWDGTQANYFKSGPYPGVAGVSCANTGELPAVFLHEWGHGMDANSGGQADYASGEATGDTFAFLETKDGCIGTGFWTGSNQCTNCAASCTGVRDVNAFSTHGAATIAKPSNIAANGGMNCDAVLGLNSVACPYRRPDNGVAYQGPMGYEGHCESYIASSANWDLAQALVTQYGATQGYAAMDKIWYGSLTPSKAAYRVASGGQCNPSAAVDGCGANNWYTVYLAADDDDGNLANGTPNACRIWDAFNAHGIACGARPVCSGGGTPNVPPVANFSSTTSGLTANFTDSSTDSDGTIASRAWNFGDGGTSTATNPSHAYTAGGTYSVSLTVTDNGGATNTKTSSVTVTGTPPANVPPVANFSVTTSGLTANFTDSSTDSDGTIASRAWNFGDGGTSTATNPSRAYATAGTYSVSLTVTDNGGATNTKTSSVTVSTSGGPTVLQNGVAVTGLSAAINVDKLFTLTVPAGATNLKFVTAGGTGDADLYVKFGSAPTTTTNDCKSEGGTTAETCSIATAQAGTYYVLIHAYSAYSGVSLTGSYTTGSGGSVLQNGVAVSGLSGAANSDKLYTLVVTAGATNLKFVTAGGTGDADLYVRFGSAPTTSTYTCRSWAAGNAETCNIAAAQAGTYYVLVHGYSAYSGASLTGSFTP